MNTMQAKQKRLLFAWFILFCIVATQNSLPLVLAVSTETIAAADQLYDTRERLERVEESIALLEAALQRAKQSNSEIQYEYELLWRLARAYEWLGRMSETKDKQRALYEKANEFAAAAVDVNEDGYEGYYWYAITLGRVGELRGIFNSLSAAKQMRGHLERVIALQPEHAGAHYALGTLYRLLPGWPLAYGDKNVALEYMQKATALWPENTTYQIGLAESLLALKQYEQAEHVLRNVLDMPLTPGEHVESTLDKEEAKAILEQHF